MMKPIDCQKENKLDAIIDNYSQSVREEFANVIDSWPIKYDNLPVFPLLACLLARQAALALLVANNKMLWNGHIGALYLRCMLEVYIKLAWIIGDPSIRAPIVIATDIRSIAANHNDVVEQLKSQGQEEFNNSAAINDWIQDQQSLYNPKITKQTPDVRKMAVEASEAALSWYRRYYVTLSSCLHSTWNHISRFNLVRSENPLHRFHFIPTLGTYSVRIDYLVIAAELFDVSINLLPRKDQKNSSYHALLAALDIRKNNIADATGPTEEFGAS